MTAYVVGFWINPKFRIDCLKRLMILDTERNQTNFFQAKFLTKNENSENNEPINHGIEYTKFNKTTNLDQFETI